MNPLIRECLEAREQLQAAMNRSLDADKAAEDVPLPEGLRLAEARDILPGAVIWYQPESHFSRHYWVQVKRVLQTEDGFEAFIGHDGARHGLLWAYVETEKGVRHAG